MIKTHFVCLYNLQMKMVLEVQVALVDQVAHRSLCLAAQPGLVGLVGQ